MVPAISTVLGSIPVVRILKAARVSRAPKRLEKVRSAAPALTQDAAITEGEGEDETFQSLSAAKSVDAKAAPAVHDRLLTLPKGGV